MIVGTTVCMAIGLAGCASTGSSSFLYKNITVACCPVRIEGNQVQVALPENFT